MGETKKCQGCGRTLPLDSFHRKGTGHFARCKRCRSVDAATKYRYRRSTGQPIQADWKPKVCERCGQTYTPTGPAQRWCSVDCRYRGEDGGPRSYGEAECPRCGTTFTKARKAQRYCSAACLVGETRQAAEQTAECTECGRPYTPAHGRQRYCSRTCRDRALELPIGTERMDPETGYVIVKVPVDTPGRFTARSWMPAHRYVMQEKLGRPLLPTEDVHHVNGQRWDNGEGNLELWVTDQPRGQRVEDKVAFGLEMLRRYAPHLLAEERK